jgi:hypothetical protein
MDCIRKPRGDSDSTVPPHHDLSTSLSALLIAGAHSERCLVRGWVQTNTVWQVLEGSWTPKKKPSLKNDVEAAKGDDDGQFPPLPPLLLLN